MRDHEIEGAWSLSKLQIRRAARSPRQSGSFAESLGGAFQTEDPALRRPRIGMPEQRGGPRHGDLDGHRRDLSRDLRPFRVVVVGAWRLGFVLVASIHGAIPAGLIMVMIMVVIRRGERQCGRRVVDRQGMLNVVGHGLRTLHDNKRTQDHQYDDQRVPHGPKAQGCEH
jgi:hypothetical protein